MIDVELNIELLSLALMEMVVEGYISESNAEDVVIDLLFSEEPDLESYDVSMARHIMNKYVNSDNIDDLLVYLDESISNKILPLTMYNIASDSILNNYISMEDFNEIRTVTYGMELTDSHNRIMDAIIRTSGISVIEDNPSYIEMIDDPSPELQLLAVKLDKSTIQYIKNPTADVLLYVNGIV